MTRTRAQPGIEGIRGLAAAGVLLHHVNAMTAGDVGGVAGVVISHGWLGVQVFFVLSGFLLYLPFVNASLHGRPGPSIRRYFKSRLLRILPAYWLAVTVCAPLVWWTPLAESLVIVPALLGLILAPIYLSRLRGGARLVATGVLTVAAGAAGAAVIYSWAAQALLTNYALAQFYPGVDMWRVIMPSWTLVVELAFYATLPLLAIALHRLSRRLAVPRSRAALQLAALAAFVPLGLAYRTVLFRSGDQLPVPGYIDQFALGMMLAVVVALGSWRPRATVLTMAAVGVGAVAVALRDVGPVELAAPASFLYGPSFAAAAMLLMASVVLPARPSPVARVLQLRPVAWLGLVSYGVYLWHWPMILLLTRHGVWTDTLGLNALLVGTLTLAAAAASWYGVERHALRLKDKQMHFTPRIARRLPAEAAPAL